ncbi:MAG TPA: glycosyltransferase family 2 protein [bacterium]|nr:glycosyltransferase family 2 protein [bacterium]HQI49052.1 glycosyltransferase family 2 protein [bacterium]
MAGENHDPVGAMQPDLEILMHPAVSIILPVYNRRHLLERALASVEAQTFTDYELLIVDDGSSDGLEAWMPALQEMHPNWRYLRHRNRRLSATRNIGIHAALSEWVTFLDADDEYRPDHLRLRIEYVRARPEVDLVHGGVELCGPEESHWVEDAFHPGALIHLSQCIIGSTLFGRKRLFLESGGFRLQDYSAESELIARLSERYTIERVDFPTYIYHTGLPDSICTLRKSGRAQGAPE